MGAQWEGMQERAGWRETKQSTQKGRGSWQRLLEKQSEQKEKKNEDSEEF